MSKKSVLALSIVLVVGLIAGGFYVYSSRRIDAAQVAALQAVELLRSENLSVKGGAQLVEPTSINIDFTAAASGENSLTDAVLTFPDLADAKLQLEVRSVSGRTFVQIKKGKNSLPSRVSDPLQRAILENSQDLITRYEGRWVEISQERSDTTECLNRLSSLSSEELTKAYREHSFLQLESQTKNSYTFTVSNKVADFLEQLGLPTDCITQGGRIVLAKNQEGDVASVEIEMKNVQMQVSRTADQLEIAKPKNSLPLERLRKELTQLFL